VTKCNYDKSPFVPVSNAVHGCRLGWSAIGDELQQALAKGRSEKPILVVECYPGVDEPTIIKELKARLSPRRVTKSICGERSKLGKDADNSVLSPWRAPIEF